MTTFQREFEEEVRDDLRELLGGLRMDGGIYHTDHQDILPPLLQTPVGAGMTPMSLAYKVGDALSPMDVVRKATDVDLANAFENWFNTSNKPTEFDIFKV